MSDLRMTYIELRLLSEFWPLVRQNVTKAVEYSNGQHSEKTVLDELIKGNLQLWIVYENDEILTPMVTHISLYPTGKKVCDIFAVGGSGVKKWLDMTTQVISEWAINLGCSTIRVTGRPGWSKILKDWGEHTTVTVERQIGV